MPDHPVPNPRHAETDGSGGTGADISGSTRPDVVVIGAGPVGLLTAAELHRHGVHVRLLEQRGDPAAGSRAIGIHAPVLDALEPSGLTEALLECARRVPYAEARSGGTLLGQVHFSRLSTRFPFVATLPQAATESVLRRAAPAPHQAEQVTALLSETHQARAVTSSQEHRAPLVVLAGGARSRPLLGTAERVHHYPDKYVMTDLDVPEPADSPTAVVHLEPRGVVESFPLPNARRRIVSYDPWPHSPAASGTPDRTQRMIRVLDSLGLELTGEVTGFGVRRFVTQRMRRGRVLVIGDAAHEVSPMGGQGMNLGLLDGVSLAPLVAQWLRSGQTPEAELRAWEAQRISSARRAAALAAMNTHLGRPAGPTRHTARSAAVRLMLGPGARRVFAHGYSMGFDRHRGPTLQGRPAESG